MASLYELTGDFLKVREMLFDEDADIEMIENTLDCIDCLFEEKADNYAKILQYINDDISGIKNEMERLKIRKEMIQKRSDRLKQKLKTSMEITGKTKFSITLYTFSIRKNGGLEPLKNVKKSLDNCIQYLNELKERENNEYLQQAI